MDTVLYKYVLTLVTFLGLIDHVIGNLASESVTNAATVTFYMMRPNQWTDGTDVKSRLSNILVNEANRYCQNNIARCGLKYWDQSFAFTEQQVSYVEQDSKETYPIEGSSELTVKLYLQFNSVLINTPTATNITSYVINKEALEALIGEGRYEIKASVGWAVTSVGMTAYTPPPDYLLNIIMCILALVLLLVVILSALGCWLYAKKREQAKKKRTIPNQVAPTPESLRSFRVKKSEPPATVIIPEPTVIPETEPVIEKKKKKRKKSAKKRPEEANITIVPMPDGNASYAFQRETDDEEDHDSGMGNGTHNFSENHYENGYYHQRMTTEM